MGRKSLVALSVVMPATVALLAQQSVTIKVNASEPQADFQPLRHGLGMMNPITPTMRKGSSYLPSSRASVRPLRYLWPWLRSDLAAW